MILDLKSGSLWVPHQCLNEKLLFHPGISMVLDLKVVACGSHMIKLRISKLKSNLHLIHFYAFHLAALFSLYELRGFTKGLRK